MTTWTLRHGLIAAVISGIFLASCSQPPRTIMEGLLESRRLSAEMLVQFEKELEASNRAVMADTGEASAVAGQDAEQASRTLQSDSHTLAGLLAGLDYGTERATLQEFISRFDELNALNREILDLAALDTNIKAQKLSFGAAEDAAVRVASALETIRSGSSPQAHAMASDTLAALREIQALQAPHIAEPQDAVMDRIEERMRTAEAAVRKSLAALSAAATTRAAAQRASQEFETFMEIHAEILQLSRRNTNVKSLALSMGRQRTLAAQCEERLNALRQALDKRDIFFGAR